MARKSGDLTSTTGPLRKELQMDDPMSALVKRENRAVFAIRLAVLGVIVTAAVAASTFMFLFARNAEIKAYENSLLGVGDRIVESFLSDTALKFGLAASVAGGLSTLLAVPGTNAYNVTIPEEQWSQLVGSSVLTGSAWLVGWSPVLRSDEERIVFEEVFSGAEVPDSSGPPCYVCVDPAKGFTDSKTAVDLPGVGRTSCLAIDFAARSGFVPNGLCPTLQQLVVDICECVELDLEEQSGAVESGVVGETHEKIFFIDTETGNELEEPYGQAVYLPLAQVLITAEMKIQPRLFNLLSSPPRAKALRQMLKTGGATMSEKYETDSLPFYETQNSAIPFGSDVSALYYPVKDATGQIVAAVGLEFRWNQYITSVFPAMAQFVDVVISNTCSGSSTYRVDTTVDELLFVGSGDLHDPKFGSSDFRSTTEEYDILLQSHSPRSRDSDNDAECRYEFAVYSTQSFEEQFLSPKPVMFAAVAACIFLFTAITFWLYDFVVKRRQEKVMASATQSNNLISSLFPETVRMRMMSREANGAAMGDPTQGKNSETASVYVEPIADLFPSVTCMFLDISGFTCWSSERSPSDVFSLLETLYSSFDEIARTMGVFKVETIGDAYFAVCGLPEPNERHAEVMARFSVACLDRMSIVTSELEIHLGPSTADLQARVGLHSGPVTAGVLRGEKARFQLFGDTVNVASRIESTSLANRIHASTETAEALITSGFGHWVEQRDDKIVLKGKGLYNTYWINVSSESTSTMNKNSESVNETFSEAVTSFSTSSNGAKNTRLIEWNTELLFKLLQDVVSARVGSKADCMSKERLMEMEALPFTKPGSTAFEEMTTVLELPQNLQYRRRPKSNACINPAVKQQVREFITRISYLYNDVPFHNFEHCSHVIMSASKLMKRMMDTKGVNCGGSSASHLISQHMHKATYGLSSDPIIAFAVVFAALIHDAGHLGVTNQELCVLHSDLSQLYKAKSVAEQNSVDVAWKIFMEDGFAQLRACIYTCSEERKFFRQLIVNAVMATDIADQELKQIRESRWNEAFPKDGSSPMLESSQVNNRKATIVFEYIIQASDIAHTMQHWMTYIKFNRRLFEERYLAFSSGHCSKDPSTGWYKGELWFFDNYIIPLAHKLKDCGVFGVSHFEFLSYAQQNRSEWTNKGEQIVAEMLEECKRKYPTSTTQ